MPKKLIPPCTVVSDPSEKIRSSVGTSHTEPSVQTVFRSLITKLAVSGHNHSSPPMQAPLVEVEHEGQIYSLFCRKKQACPAFIELSPREKDIARMIATGLPNKTIASALEISEFTVSTHLRRIFAKLGVSCRAAMVSKWLESHALCKSGVSTHDLLATRMQTPVNSLIENRSPIDSNVEIRFTESSDNHQRPRLERNSFQGLPETRNPVTTTPKVRLNRIEAIEKPR